MADAHAEHEPREASDDSLQRGKGGQTRLGLGTKKNPLFGVVLSSKKPRMNDELRWFSGLYDAVVRGDTVAFVAEARAVRWDSARSEP